MYTLDDFDFELPESQIAQTPSKNRGDSRLFVLNRENELFSYSNFPSIKDFLKKGDLLVFNDAKVIPARMFFKRNTGATVEIVLARMIDLSSWLVVTNRTKKLKCGEVISSVVDESLTFTVGARKDEYITITSSEPLTDELLERVGKIPLPPYIRRDPSKEDLERYQTVYAEKSGAVAAPTAGLHFTDEILDSLKGAGVDLAWLTLYVSWGTFSPVRTTTLDEHKMHSEQYELTDDVAEKINCARSEGRRVIAVGTTALRVLESTFIDGKNIAQKGETDIFIYPPKKVLSIDGLITNFHTPKSTLLMLIAAVVGYDLVMRAYKDAVEKGFHFFSYGDSMFIE